MALSNAYQLPFSGYEPHPEIPGAYNFTPASGGNPILAAGPEAERMRAMLDRTPKPDARLASNAPGFTGPGIDPSWIQAQHDAEGANAMRAALAPAAHAPAATQAAPTAAGILSGATPLSPGQPSPASAPQAQVGAQPTPQPVMRNITGTGGESSPAGAAGAPPGPNPQDYLTHTYVKSGFTPSARKVVTEGGVQDPELAKAMASAASEKMHADQAQAEADKLQQLHLVQQSQIQAAEAAKTEEAARQKRLANLAAQDQATKEYSRVMGLAQKDLEAKSGQEVDNDRLFKGRYGGKIGAAIAAGLGAFGATISHTPNFALDILNKQIDDDISSQREAINRGVAAKNNNLLRLRDKYNVDTGTAEKLYGVFATEEAQNMARKQAALQGGAEAQSRLQTIDSALAAKKMQLLKDIQSDIYGKAQITAEEKYRQGGVSVGVNPDLKATAQAAELIGKTGTGLGQAAKGAYEASHEGQAPPKAGAGGPGKLSARLGATEAINESATEDLKVLEKADAGGYVAPSVHVPGLGTRGTDARTQLDTAARALVGKVIAAKGETPSHEAVEAEMERAANANPAVREAYRKYAQDTLKTVHSAVERQRGNTAVSTQDAAEAAESQ